MRVDINTVSTETLEADAVTKRIDLVLEAEKQKSATAVEGDVPKQVVPCFRRTGPRILELSVFAALGFIRCWTLFSLLASFWGFWVGLPRTNLPSA